MAKDAWTYHAPENLAPGIKRILRMQAWAPRFERLPVPVSRTLMDLTSRFANPRRNKKLIETVHAPFPGSPVRLRSWEPVALKGSRPLVLYMHGGGFVLGSSRSHRAFCELLADEAQCSVYSIDYRLAPEHPYPAAIEDVDRAYEWLLKLRDVRGWTAQPIAVAGDSAGGNLATILCRRLRDRGETLPDAQLLIYPVTDFARNTPSHDKYAEGLVLTRSLIDWFFLHYKANPIDHHDVSPLGCKDLRGLPKTFVALAGCDVLLDEGRAYAERLKEAGVPVTVRVFPDMIHAFVNLLLVPEAHAAALECIDFLKNHFEKHQTGKEKTDGKEQAPDRARALAT
ncbi:MAG TPA: alpha/beta hydrolase [Oligoflexus sp.]|uniref:alpha/beta hydrolase n=1 Tax=Oligoflexus sp. TaxID=1971216 RepID=UPI002D7F96FF|nr:alpha/beta hydrolase [Oligoflexus sp.]HET9236704.1 alpha/beta hydrolase [Oligoflexus sp.]